MLGKKTENKGKEDHLLLYVIMDGNHAATTLLINRIVFPIFNSWRLVLIFGVFRKGAHQGRRTSLFNARTSKSLFYF